MPEEITDEQRKVLQEKLKNMSPEEIAQLQKQQCIFCQIISGKIPSKKVYEDQLMMAILDINPGAKGHLLLIPKTHYIILPHVPDSELAHLFLVAQKLSQSILRAFKVGGTTLFIANGQVAGQRAQHVMMHIIPRKEGDNVIAFEEKLIGSEMASKVQLAVKPTFFKHLGMEDNSTPHLGEGDSADAIGKVEEKKRSDEKNRNEKVAAIEKLPSKSSPVTPANKAVKKSSDSEKKGDKSESSAILRRDDDVSLDDIANLFK